MHEHSTLFPGGLKQPPAPAEVNSAGGPTPNSARVGRCARGPNPACPTALSGFAPGGAAVCTGGGVIYELGRSGGAGTLRVRAGRRLLRLWVVPAWSPG